MRIILLLLSLFFLMTSCKQDQATIEGSSDGRRRVNIQIDTWFKITDLKQSNELTLKTQKCRLRRGEYLILMKGTQPKLTEDRHYFVELERGHEIPGCDFEKGYVWGPHANLRPTSSSGSGGGNGKYIRPLKNVTFGSRWCECRNVGTSPHIGQDMYNWDPQQISYAPRSGTVHAVSDWGKCGMTVDFVDNGGVKWRFLHILDVYVNPGQNINQGTKIGLHDYFPLPGCGTGPHLHLERLTQGDIKDAGCKMNNCQDGWSVCNYDPVSVFDGNNRDNKFYGCQ